MTTRRIQEFAALLPPPEDRGGIELGTVGWEDGGDHFDIEADGPTLVKVTLWRGRNPDSDPAEVTTRAKGHQILARISQPLNYVPPDGSEVLVAIPAGLGGVPGAAMIIGVANDQPSTQFSGARAKLDFGPDVDLVIKAKSVTLTDYEDRYFTVGPQFGIKMGDADANGAQLKNGKWAFYTAEDGNATAVLQVAKAGIKLMLNDGKTVVLTMGGGKLMMGAEIFMAKAAAGYLGVAPTVLTPIAFIGPGGPSASAAWFVSPT